MVKDNEKEEVMEFLSSMLNIEYSDMTLGDKSYHIPYEELPNKYLDYTIKQFLFFYRLDCLLENNLITEEIKNQLLDLYNYYMELDSKYSQYCMDEHQARRDLDDIERRREPSKEEMEEIERRRKEANEQRDIIYKKMKEVEQIFNNYHLLDKIDLGKILEITTVVDNPNLDLKKEINNIR